MASCQAVNILSSFTRGFNDIDVMVDLEKAKEMNKITWDDIELGEWGRNSFKLFETKINIIFLIMVVWSGRKIFVERLIIGRWHPKDKFSKAEIDERIKKMTDDEINWLNNLFGKRIGLPYHKGYFKVKDIIPYKTIGQINEIMKENNV